MKKSGIAAVIALLLGSGFLVDFRISTQSSISPPASVSVGQVSTLISAYEKWKAGLDSTTVDQQLVLSLGHWKGLSEDFTKAHGSLILDLEQGVVRVSVSGLPEGRNYDFWLIGRGSNRHAKADLAGHGIHLGTLTEQGGSTQLTRSLQGQIPNGFAMELAVITRADVLPEEGAMLYASPSLFQRLYYAEQQGLFTGKHAEQVKSRPYAFMIPKPSYAAEPGQSLETLLSDLVSDGEKLFFGLPPLEEAAQFAGNGRTCGTCHPPENNFTIDPAFIATLPVDDPLFVAEFDPNLHELERPVLMREFGLILENLDGFDDPAHKFVMRSVPHLFALNTSITPSAGFSHTSSTGWSGDGAPLDGQFPSQDGSLRAFAIGAVKQHFTKSLDREVGIDFRLPTSLELDALEAFQLSLGRVEDPNLFSTFFLSEPLVQNGRLLFLQQGQCIFCHFNAGANDIIFRVNGNLDTNIEELADIPSRQVDPSMPRDGGFGTLPDGLGGYGDGGFNPPPLIEAADTAPFFHNNARVTLEDAIRFYNTETFNNSPGAVAQGVSIDLQDPQDVEAIGAFLRAMNALENIRNAIALDTQIKNTDLLSVSLDEGRRIMLISRADTEDVRQVLENGPHDLYPDAQTHLKKSIKKLDLAIAATTSEDRSFYIKKAIRQRKKARGLIVFE